MNKKIIENAYNIAKHDLKKNYSDKGILCGKFRKHYWAWDSFFASWGSIFLDDFDIVKKNFELYLSWQKKDGLLPKRIAPYNYPLIYIGVPPGKLVPSYKSPYSNKPMLTQNDVFLVTLKKYIIKSKDIEFIKNNIKKIKKAANWTIKKEEKDHLIKESFGQNWAESILKRGKILFTNVMHYYAIKSTSYLLKKINDSNYKKYEKISIHIENEIKKKFWDGNYFIDWIDNKKHKDYCSDGNFLAIISGLANKEMCKKIMEHKYKKRIDEKFPTTTNYPMIDIKKEFLFNRIGGIGKYHNGFSWIWIGCLDAVSLYKCKNKDIAYSKMEWMSKSIIKYNTVSEIYDEKGNKIKKRFYKSDDEFAWSAGMFIWAYNEIYG